MKKNKFKITLLLYLFLIMMVFPYSALAYIDPSTTSFLVQAIVGVVAAVGAGVVLYWRRAKRKVSEKLGLDENIKKDVESDDIEIFNQDK